MIRSKLKRSLPLLMLLALLGCGRQEAPAAETGEQLLVTEETAAPTETVLPTETEPPETEPEERVFTLSFAGDCTFGAAPSIYHAPVGFLKTVGDDFGYPFRNVAQYLSTDDFTMVNLEGPLGEVGNLVPKQHNFRGPVKYVNVLLEGSVEAVTIANNHTMDYGPACYASTVETLTEAGVPFVERDSTLLLPLEGGLTLGIYGTSYEYVDEEALTAGIAGLKEQGADIVIYAAHWGVEGSYVPHPYQEKLGRMAIDAGADIVFGTHPHVLQPVEEYGNGVILYSLGNFSFGGNCGPEDYDTAIIQQQVILDGQGNVRLGQRTCIPCCLSSEQGRNNFQPTPYEPGTESYERVLRKLSGTYR